ncbi:MAG: TolC family protein [Candidatus Eremiobacteraeota bacterium]|nr:TolC family protein [Candidatus Eremiobacteraeota bacterium]
MTVLAAAFAATGVSAQPAGSAVRPAPAATPAAKRVPSKTRAARPRSTAVPDPLGALPPIVQPTPYPMVTLGPASQGTSLPFPAYGSPVPGVGVGPAPSASGLPQVVTLPQAIAIAFARSPALASARADEGIAHASKRLAQTGYYPNLSATGTTTHTNRQAGATSGAGGVASSGSVTSFTQDGLSLSLRQLIFDGGRIGQTIRAASYNEAAAVDVYRRILQTVAFNVAQAYYAQLQAQRTTAVAVQTVRLDLLQENLVRAQIRAGVAAPADLSTAQLPTAQAHLALVRAQAVELNAQATFVNAMGLDANLNVLPFDDTPVTATGAISTIPVPSYDQALARAYALRPDFSASQRSVQASESSLRASQLGIFPTISGTASTATNSTDPTAGTFRNTGSLGLSISIPLFDQGITAANVLQSRAQLERANAQLEIARQGLQLNVKQALVNLVSASASLDQAQAEYLKANDVLHATQAQYRAGVTTLPLLLNAQVGLTQALTDQVTAVYALRQAEQAYLYATGANTP